MLDDVGLYLSRCRASDILSLEYSERKAHPVPAFRQFANHLASMVIATSTRLKTTHLRSNLCACRLSQNTKLACWERSGPSLLSSSPRSYARSQTGTESSNRLVQRHDLVLTKGYIRSDVHTSFEGGARWERRIVILRVDLENMVGIDAFREMVASGC